MKKHYHIIKKYGKIVWKRRTNYNNNNKTNQKGEEQNVKKINFKYCCCNIVLLDKCDGRRK